ncbi:MAG: Gfo/Idh/MocA family protein [Flexilinea sp.]
MANKIRFGMITVDPHGRPWAEVVNRYYLDEVEMVWAWDYSLDRAKWYAKKYGIPNVAGNIEEFVDKVDAVLIGGGRRSPDENGMWGENKDDHLMLSKPFLERGKAVLIDKPFADDVEDAVEMVKLARKNKALLMSCSAMRYDTLSTSARQIVDDGGVGTVRAAQLFIGCGLAKLKWYLVHITEAIYTVFGPGVESVVALPANNENVIGPRKTPRAFGFVYRWKDGRLATIMMVQDETDAAEVKVHTNREQRILWPTETIVPPYLPLHYSMSVYGDMDFISQKSAGKGCYRNKIHAFIDMIKTKKEAIPLEETLEITETINAAERAVISGKAERVTPVEELLK